MPGAPVAAAGVGHVPETVVMHWLGFLQALISRSWLRLSWRALMLMPNDARIRMLRRAGVRIGEDCLIYTNLFSTEPYLVEIGNHVAVSAGTRFITHDASGFLFADHPDMDVFGMIKVGDNTYFGTDVTVLPGTTIGRDCIIGSCAVVRGDVPDGSVVMGNPGRVVMKTALLKHLLVHHKHRLDTRHLAPRAKEQVLRRHFGLPPAGKE